MQDPKFQIVFSSAFLLVGGINCLDNMQQKKSIYFCSGSSISRKCIDRQAKDLCSILPLAKSFFFSVTSVPMFYIPLLGNVFQIEREEELQIINQSVTSQNTTPPLVFWIFNVLSVSKMVREVSITNFQFAVAMGADRVVKFSSVLGSKYFYECLIFKMPTIYC